MTFEDFYGIRLDAEIGSTDRTERFTTERRKAAFNLGLEKFNERAGCYVRRATITLSDGVAEYDLETAGVLAAGDYLRPAKTGATLSMDNGTTVAYREGDGFMFATEDELNTDIPGWRGHDPGVPTRWYVRPNAGTTLLGLHVAPDVPVGSTWTVLFPYVAVAPTLTDDADEPYGGRVALRPYLDGPLAYAAAEMEKLRKNYDGVQMQMQKFVAVIAQYQSDTQPARGSRIRVASDYRSRLRSRRSSHTAFGR